MVFPPSSEKFEVAPAADDSACFSTARFASLDASLPPMAVPLPVTALAARQAAPLAGVGRHRRAQEPLSRVTHVLVLMVLVLIALIACALKILTIEGFHRAPVWAVYSVMVTVFILSRFGLAWFYRPRLRSNAASYRPAVAIIVPAYNKQDGIAATSGHAYPSIILLTVCALLWSTIDLPIPRSPASVRWKRRTQKSPLSRRTPTAANGTLLQPG